MGFRLAIMGATLAVCAAQAAVADASTGFHVEGIVTSVAVEDTFSKNNGTNEIVLELTFDRAGIECGNARAAGAVYTITNVSAPNAFDTFVKTAQAAYLSGRILQYQTLQTSTNVCRPQFMTLK